MTRRPELPSLTRTRLSGPALERIISTAFTAATGLPEPEIDSWPADRPHRVDHDVLHRLSELGLTPQQISYATGYSINHTYLILRTGGGNA